MSCDCDWEANGDWQDISDTELRCRKPFKCEECDRLVERGEIYRRMVGKWEGDLCVSKTCLRCKRISRCHFRAAAQVRCSDGVVLGELRCAVACLAREEPQYLERFRKEWKESAVHGPAQA